LEESYCESTLNNKKRIWQAKRIEVSRIIRKSLQRKTDDEESLRVNAVEGKQQGKRIEEVDT
jgi:hypothetical protein